MLSMIRSNLTLTAAIRNCANYFIISAICLLALPLTAQFPEIACYHQDPGAHERDRNIDVTKMKVTVSFNTLEKSVSGLVSHQFKSLQSLVDTIFFDAPGINIISVSLDAKPITFRSNAKGLIVHANLKNDYGKTHQINITYTAHPQKGIYFIGWEQPEITDPANMGRKQIWTQGQGIDNRHWIPMIDDRGEKYITETVVTFDSKYKVLSNGALLSKIDNKNGNTTWNYAMSKPHAGYLLMLAIGDYDIKQSKTVNGTPLNFWYYPEHPERVEPTFRYSEKIIEHLEKETGISYPWGSYSQVMIQDFLYGAMENTSATTFGDFFWVDARGFQDRNYITVNAHEATHQWFGDLITGRNDGEQWLQESFATFYPGLFLGTVYGDDERNWYYREQMRGAIAAGKTNSLPVRHSAAGSSRHYPKGASVLFMLRHVLGEENYKRSINLYLNRHQYATVETADLQKAIIDATGINMDWFFDQWIWRGGEPTYKVDWKQLGEKSVVLNIQQTQVHDAVVRDFKMPIDIGIMYGDGSTEIITAVIEKSFQMLELPISQINGIFKQVKTVIFDVNSGVLKSIDFAKSDAEWLWQMQYATNMLDRYDALMALKDKNYKAKSEILLALYIAENFREMKVELAVQLMSATLALPSISLPLANSIDQTPALNMAQALITSPFAAVRKVAIEQLDVGNNEHKDFFLAALKDSSYANVEFVLNKIWYATPFENDKIKILDAMSMEQGYLHNLKIKYLELAFEQALQSETLARSKMLTAAMAGTLQPSLAMRNENEAQIVVNQLVEMAGPKFEFRTRTNAMGALKRLNYLDENLAKNLFDGVLGFNARLAQPSIELIQYFKQQTNNKMLFQGLLLNKISSNAGPLYSPEQLKKLKGIM